MSRRRRQDLSTWLRSLLAVMLALQLGLAQATMVASHAVAADETRAAPAGTDMPCHGDMTAQADAGHESTSHARSQGCCDPGSCHCTAASGLPASSQVSVTTRPPLWQPGVPAGQNGRTPVPDLRPPIG